MQEPPAPHPQTGGVSGPQGPSQDVTTRRRLVRLGWISAVLVAVGGQLWFLLKLFLTPPPPGEGRGQFSVGRLAQFPVGSVTHFRKERFLLVRHPTGVLALADECTHQKCTVAYVPERDVLFCPCHSAQFSVTGTVLMGPAPRPLERFVTTVQDGQVIVDTAHRSSL